MPVSRREYIAHKTRKPVWGYAFSFMKSRYRKAGFHTKHEAEQAEESKRREVMSNQPRIIPQDKLTFDTLMPSFLEHRKIIRAPKTYEAEARIGRRILKPFHNHRLNSISPAEIHAYIAQRKEDGVANRTVNLELSFLRSFYKYAMEIGIVASCPLSNVRNLREVRTEQRIPTQEQFQRFVAEAERTRFARILVPWIWFRAYTGTRPTESFFVQWQDIDFQNKQVKITPKKGNPLKNGCFRVIDMHPKLESILLNWRKDWAEIMKREPGEDDWVFFHPRRKSTRANGYRKSFVLARDAAGLSYFTSHGLRHYFISQAVMSGINFLTIAKWVGHATTLMIERTYGHLNSGYRREQMNMLKVG